MQKASGEKMRSGELKFTANGRKVTRPEIVLEALNKRMLSMEKQRDELKPQWLQEWQNSQGRGESAPP